MGMLCFTIRISSSKLLKGSCSPEAGKVTVPCHSPCSMPVTEISNKGAFFMVCWLLLWNVCAGMGAPYRTEAMAPVISFAYFLFYQKKKSCAIARFTPKNGSCLRDHPEAYFYRSIYCFRSCRWSIPSFFMALDKCRFTVLGEVFMCFPISSLVQPRAASMHTANSVVVRSSATS